MSAVTLTREAAKSGVWVGLNGGNLALKVPAKPPDALLAKLKAHKAEIVTCYGKQPVPSVRRDIPMLNG
jgi:hypothetical protein